MQLVSNTKFQGNVECRNGINEEALFAACVDANWNKQDSALDMVGGIELAINSVGHCLGLVDSSTEMLEWLWNVSKKSNGRNTAVEILRKSDKSTQWSATKIRSLQQVIESFSRIESTLISEWVKTKFLEILYLLSDCETEDSNSYGDREDAGLSLIFTLASLLILDHLAVHQLSYTPIPMESLQSPYAKPLLVGMTVNMSNNNHQAKSTPFGVALLRVCSEKVQSDPSDSFSSNRMLLRGVGYGESVRLNASQQVSISVAEAIQDTVPPCSENPSKRFASDLWINDKITHMETNLDDTTGENLAFVISLLLDNGAIDAFVTPIVMKKGRPAHTLHCLCLDDTTGESTKVKRLLELIFRHTTTLGIRIYNDMPRAKLCRSMVTVQTSFVETVRGGKVDVKVSSFKNGEVVAAKAEFDHCKEIALETGTPLSLVSDQALTLARKEFQGASKT